MSKDRLLRIATRESPLALWQARRVQQLLGGAGVATELVLIRSHGDANLIDPLVSVGATTGVGVGVFTKALDDALRDGRADVAVHSCKDYPTQLPEGIAQAAIPERAKVEDVLVVPSRLAGTRPRAREVLASIVGDSSAPLGTGSPRRQAQIRLMEPTARLEGIRGNVGTRLRKLHEGQYSALVMARAGLERLGVEQCPELEGLLLLPFHPVDEIVPAPGQGALLVTCRTDDKQAIQTMAAHNNPVVQAAVTAERTCLAAIGGGCFVPMGAWAERALAIGKLRITAVLVDDRGEVRRTTATGDIRDPEELGRRAGAQLLRPHEPRP